MVHRPELHEPQQGARGAKAAPRERREAAARPAPEPEEVPERWAPAASHDLERTLRARALTALEAAPSASPSERSDSAAPPPKRPRPKGGVVILRGAEGGVPPAATTAPDA